MFLYHFFHLAANVELLWGDIQFREGGGGLHQFDEIASLLSAICSWQSHRQSGRTAEENKFRIEPKVTASECWDEGPRF